MDTQAYNNKLNILGEETRFLLLRAKSRIWWWQARARSKHWKVFSAKFSGASAIMVNPGKKQQQRISWPSPRKTLLQLCSATFPTRTTPILGGGLEKKKTSVMDQIFEKSHLNLGSINSVDQTFLRNYSSRYGREWKCCILENLW